MYVYVCVYVSYVHDHEKSSISSLYSLLLDPDVYKVVWPA